MEVAQKYYFAAGVSGCDMKGKTLEEGCEAAANWLDNLRRCYTPYTSLKAVGIGQGDISEMVKMAMTVRRLLDPNPALVEEVDAEAIYSAVLD